MPAHAMHRGAADLMNTGSGSADSVAAARASAARPVAQVVSTVKMTSRDQQREPAAVGDLGDVRGEIGAVDDQRRRRSSASRAARFQLPDLEDQHAEHHGGDEHRAGDRDAIGRRRGWPTSRKPRTSSMTIASRPQLTAGM